MAIGSEEKAKVAGEPMIEIETSSGRVRVVKAVEPATLRVVIGLMRGG